VAVVVQAAASGAAVDVLSSKVIPMATRRRTCKLPTHAVVAAVVALLPPFVAADAVAVLPLVAAN